MCLTPRWASASTTAFCTAGVEPMLPADSLGAERVVAGRRLHIDQLEARYLGRRQERVVGEGGGQRIAVGVVDHFLEEGLRRALGQPAVPLALGEQRVQHEARIVHRDQPPQHHLAGLGVDLDHRDVRAERVGGAGRAEHRAHQQLVLLRQAGQRHRGVRVAGHLERAALGAEAQVGGAGLEHVGGPFPGHLDQLLRGLAHRRAALLQAARAAGAAALGDQVGVAPFQRDLVDRDAVWGSRTRPPVLTWASMRLARTR